MNLVYQDDQGPGSDPNNSRNLGQSKQGLYYRESHPSSNKDAQNFIARTMHEIIVITKDNRFHSLKDDLIYQIEHLSPFIL